MLTRVFVEKMLAQQEHIIAALAQRRYKNGKHIEAVIDILTKRRAGNGLLQVAIRGGQEAHIHFDRRGTSEAFEFALLQDP